MLPLYDDPQAFLSLGFSLATVDHPDWHLLSPRSPASLTPNRRQPSTSVPRPSKLPVASRKRRHSTVKATTVPLRRSPRAPTSAATSIELKNPDTPLAPPTAAIATSSTNNMDSAPSLTVPNTAAFTEGMRLPSPDEIHESAQMPSWIQDIYSKIAEHNKLIEIQKTQLQQMHALAKKNQEFQLALEEAHLKLADSTPPSKNQGYQFLHFTARGRERISGIRAGLPILGISKSRILDIHFPTNTTISFLVHNDYASTAIDATSKLPASKLITDFDPCAPSLLRDPKYTNIADPLVLQSEAIRIHQERLICLVERLPTQHLQLAVAREFCFHHKWISEATYQTLYRSIYPAKTPKDTSSSVPDDVTMDSVPDS